MKIKSLLLMVLALCLTICLCACGNDTPADDASKTTQSSGNSSTTTTTQAITTTTTTTQVDDGKVTYTVTVTDEANAPIPGVRVQLCLVDCTPLITNAQGVAEFRMVEADYKVSFWGDLPEGYSSDADEFHFEEGSYEMTIVLKTIA